MYLFKGVYKLSQCRYPSLLIFRDSGEEGVYSHRKAQNPLVKRSAWNCKGHLETKISAGRDFIVQYLKLATVVIPLEGISVSVKVSVSGFWVWSLNLMPLIVSSQPRLLKISLKSLVQTVQPWWPDGAADF